MEKSEAFRQRQIARAKLPKWLAACVPLIYLSFAFGWTFLSALVAIRIHSFLRPAAPPLFERHIHPAWPFFVVLILSFLSGLSFSLFLSNYFVRLLPPVRRILDKNAEGVPGASFAASIRTSKKAMLYLGLPATVTIALVSIAF